MKIIICRFNEPNLEWIKELKYDYILYNKWEDNLPDFIKKENVIKIPNIWREEYIYLKYIVENYERLEDYLVFTQARPFDASKNFLEAIEPSEFKVLSDIQKKDDWNWHPHHWWLPIRETCLEFLDHDSNEFIYHTAGQFVVSKERILFRSSHWRKRLLAKAEQPDSKMPRVYERLWNLFLDWKTKWK